MKTDSVSKKVKTKKVTKKVKTKKVTKKVKTDSVSIVFRKQNIWQTSAHYKSLNDSLENTKTHRAKQFLDACASSANTVFKPGTKSSYNIYEFIKET